MKIIICVNASYAALSKMERGRIVEFRDDGYVLCDHKKHYYDALLISDGVYREIEPYVNQKSGYLVYDHKKEEIRFQNVK